MSTAITWQGLADCRALFARLREQTDDLTPILDTIGHELTESTKERIADEKKTPEGTAWKPLTEKYARYKSRKSSGGLLVYTGMLLQSITYNVPTQRKVVVGATEEYAKYVQAERPFLGISNDDSNAIIKHIKRALRDAN
ncbi:phage virion morphogenesis protein [Psychrobacter sp. FDAARGOS_221]|uniref:phage virion morphogenesis protein n=1 Tax=Psychrobacter sp. FDAARGOS_221 TaxID=1975705 RepID=UPI000BB56F13|nr:phage virion morphogenesis protein [Psychrobacter sp. FDAARGOS_221]PNK59463.1 hypothetical protein A6J60_000210 [Psychrobacter sp. FDAARGOS_221]PNK59921.1 hypothetical protein A6J60_002850 [Psychrobacter sp. FDAARGOS_221]PNK61468.1 hypothetical protein A6J60_011735 [Psychrobacter sp. FDAARGOS_221]